jgi:hypothetical protein
MESRGLAKKLAFHHFGGKIARPYNVLVSSTPERIEASALKTSFSQQEGEGWVCESYSPELTQTGS